MTLSIIYIVRNEEHHLDESLRSIVPMVNEIIVVDTGSSDNTKAVAEKFGCKVYSHKWMNDFSRVRNYALDRCTSDWILYLDADEKINAEFHQQIYAAMRDENTLAYTFKMRDHPNEWNSKSYLTKPFFGDQPIRLFRNKKDIRFQGRVFESVNNSIDPRKVKNTNVIIDHHLWHGKEAAYKTPKIKYYKSLYMMDFDDQKITEYAYDTATRIGIETPKKPKFDSQPEPEPEPKPETAKLKDAVGIVVLTLNCLNSTKKCIQSIMTSTTVPYKLFIVDHNSSDGTQEYLKNLRDNNSNVYIMLCNDNFGVSKGRNRATEQISQHDDIKYICYLDNDTIVTKNWLANMLTVFEYDTFTGMVGPMADWAIGPQNITNEYGNMKKTTQQLVDLVKSRKVQFIKNDSINRFCLLLPRAVIEEVGKFDETFGLFGSEENDYALRLKEYGYDIYIANNVFIHHEGRTTITSNKLNWVKIERAAGEKFASKWDEINKIGKHNVFKPRDKAPNQPTFDGKITAVWHGNVWGMDGFSNASRNIAYNLSDLVNVKVQTLHHNSLAYRRNIAPICGQNMNSRLKTLESNPVRGQRVNVFFWYLHGVGGVNMNFSETNIIYTMYETDDIEKSAVNFLNKVNLVIVPSEWNKEIFIRNGVRTRIEVVPLGVNTEVFNGENRAHKGTFNFLYNSTWNFRKGIDLLAQAYYRAFTPKDNVNLTIKTNHQDQQLIIAYMAKYAGKKFQTGLPVNVIQKTYNDSQMASMYKGADCLILPSRGEGWGLSVSEAGACGLPVITTNWGGMTEYLNENNSFLIHNDGLEVNSDVVRDIPSFVNQKVAKPSLKDLVRLMRHVYQNRDDAVAKGTNLRNDLRNKYTWKHTSKKLQSIVNDFTKRVTVHGPITKSTGYTIVTQSVATSMSEKYNVNVVNHNPGPHEDAETDHVTKVKIRNAINKFSMDKSFATVHIVPVYLAKKPECDNDIIYSMFEVDGIPPAWVTRCCESKQIWVPSSFNMQTFVDSGVPESKMRKVPPILRDIDKIPHGKYKHTDLKSFRFLSMGTFDDRKGWKELIEAYTSVFDGNDDVCLIAKMDLRYSDITDINKIKKLVNNWKKSSATIILEPSVFSDAQITSLYHAADVYVTASKGEGWNMPAFETMSLGKPAIVNEWSAHLDFINDSNGYLCPIKGLEIVGSTNHTGTINDLYRKFKWAVPDIDVLAEQMIFAYEDKKARNIKGKRSQKTVTQYSSEKFLKNVARCFKDLA